jgi:tRNA-specific adenosine deaminase 3
VPNSPLLPWYKICETFAEHIQIEGLPRCFNAVVPRYAPLTSEQAILWTERYWPTQFNPAAQLLQDAPPLNQLRRVIAELDTSATTQFLQIARAAAHDAKVNGLGCGTGAVIVNPKTGQIMAVAADARWWSDEKTAHNCTDKFGPGRAENHALMRAVAMVANKELRRRLRTGGHRRFATTCKETPSGQPLTETENTYAEEFASPKSGMSTPTSPKEMDGVMASMMAMAVTSVHRKRNSTDLTIASSMSSGITNVVTRDRKTTSTEMSGSTLVRTDSNSSTTSTGSKSEGYLCSGLDLYLTHEPCICCAMAMIHSRFRACVFEKRMPGSGALTARDRKDSLGYGLFWRRELNWRVMTFQHIEEHQRGRRRRDNHKYTFHA